MILNHVVRETFSHRVDSTISRAERIQELARGSNFLQLPTDRCLTKGEPAMKARIDYTNVTEALRGMYQLEHYINNSGLEESLVHLVKMRASQINGCAYCLDMHSKDAASSMRPSRDSTCWTRGRRRRFIPSANARRSRLPRPSPGSRKAICPTRSSSAHERTSTNRS